MFFKVLTRLRHQLFRSLMGAKEAETFQNILKVGVGLCQVLRLAGCPRSFQSSVLSQVKGHALGNGLAWGRLVFLPG